MEFYERMRELRKEHGETQAQVAAAAGMTDRQYQRFETGKQKPGLTVCLPWRTTSACRWIIWPGGRTGGRCRGGFPAVQRNPLLQGRAARFWSQTLRILLSHAS